MYYQVNATFVCFMASKDKYAKLHNLKIQVGIVKDRKILQTTSMPSTIFLGINFCIKLSLEEMCHAI